MANERNTKQTYEQPWHSHRSRSSLVHTNQTKPCDGEAHNPEAEKYTRNVKQDSSICTSRIQSEFPGAHWLFPATAKTHSSKYAHV